MEWTLGAGVNPCRPARSGPNPDFPYYGSDMSNRWYLLPLLCLAILIATTSRSDAETNCTDLLAHTPPAMPRAPEGKLPQHVFILILENEGYKTTFEGPNAPYL